MSTTQPATGRAAAGGAVAGPVRRHLGLALVRHRHRPADGGTRRDDRERRAAPHPARARLLRHRPGVGGQRLRPDLRRPAAARRPGRRHPRPSPGVHRRHGPVLAGLAARRVRHHAGLAARGPRGAGRRRRGHRPDRAGPDHHHLPGGTAAQPGDGRLLRDEHRRRRGRPDGRRPADHLPVLALGAVRQRAHRRDRRAHRAAGTGRVAGPARQVRLPRRDHQHARPGGPGLRPDQRGDQPERRLALGRHQGHRRADAPRWCCSPRSSSSRRAASTR